MQLFFGYVVKFLSMHKFGFIYQFVVDKLPSKNGQVSLRDYPPKLGGNHTKGVSYEEETSSDINLTFTLTGEPLDMSGDNTELWTDIVEDELGVAIYKIREDDTQLQVMFSEDGKSYDFRGIKQ